MGLLAYMYWNKVWDRAAGANRMHTTRTVTGGAIGITKSKLPPSEINVGTAVLSILNAVH